MPKRPNAYHKPENLSEALQLLAQPDTVPLSGGTKLLANGTTDAVVDLQALGLDQIQWDEGQLDVGATVKLTDLAESLADDAQEESPSDLLQEAIRLAGPNTYRNAATLGGMIAGRLPDSELLAVLLVLDVDLTLRTPDVMSMKLGEYLSSADRPDGLITNITLPWTAGSGNIQRVARTPADYAIVSVAAWQPAGKAPRIAATGIGTRPIRLSDVEMALAGGITETTMADAAAAAKHANGHPGDFRGDASYRADMAAVLTKRACESLK